MDTSEYLLMYTVEQRHWWFSARRQFVERIFNRFDIGIGKKRKIADIGAGTGGMIDFLSQYGRVTGIEPSIQGRALAKKRGITLQKGNAEKTGLPANIFDIVCFFDVLYHKNVDEAAALAESFRLLKSNGYLVVSDCAFAFLNSSHDVAVQGARRYTRSQLSALIDQAGYRVVYSTYSFFLVFPIFVVWRLIRSIFSRFVLVEAGKSDVGQVSPLFNDVLTKICWLESFGYISGFYPWGSSVIVVAQKKDR